MCRLALLFLIAVSTNFCFGQEQLNSKEVDSKTYQAYIAANWDELIEIGKKALKNEIDYFYLRLRVGAAYYEKGNYEKAVHHLKKALKFNGENELAKEYLYLSLLYSGNHQEADLLSSQFSDTVKRRLAVSPKLFNLFSVEGGPVLAQSDSISNATYFSFGFNLKLTPRLSMFNNYSFISQTYFRTKYAQNQYYVALPFYLGRSFTLTPAVHFVRLDAEPVIKDLFTAGGFEIKKSIPYLDVAAGFTAGNFYSENQYQGHLKTSFFPLGNQKLNLSSTLYVQAQSSETSVAANGAIQWYFHENAGWGSSYQYGELSNQFAENAFFVYNSPDATNQRFKSWIEYYFKDKIGFQLTYVMEERYNTYYWREPYYYFNHSFVLEIKLMP